jgi:hypothetical protein
MPVHSLCAGLSTHTAYRILRKAISEHIQRTVHHTPTLLHCVAIAGEGTASIDGGRVCHREAVIGEADASLLTFDKLLSFHLQIASSLLSRRSWLSGCSYRGPHHLKTPISLHDWKQKDREKLWHRAELGLRFHNSHCVLVTRSRQADRLRRPRRSDRKHLITSAVTLSKASDKSQTVLSCLIHRPSLHLLACHQRVPRPCQLLESHATGLNLPSSSLFPFRFLD